MKSCRFSLFLTQNWPKNVKKKGFPKLGYKQKKGFCLVFLSCFFHYVCVHEDITMGINSGEQDKQLTETKVIATAKEEQSKPR